MKIGVYCRISRLKEGNDLSINNQKKLGIAKAKELSLPYELYIDEGKSGASDNIEDRPEFERLIKDIADDKIQAVFVYDQSRIERNPQVRHLIIEIFRKKGIKYYTELDGEIDLNDPQKEFFGDLVSVINKYQVTLTKIKVKSVLKSRVEDGKAHSILPYGYAKDSNGYLIIDKDESEVVKTIYDMSLKGTGTRSIAEYLNENNIPTRYNKINKGSLTTKNKYTNKETVKLKKEVKWEGNTIRNIIKNTIYKGVRKYSGKSYKAPAIFTEEYWQKVNDHLRENRNNSGKKVEHQYLLKGLLRCGICGRNMYGRKRVNKHDNVYICSSKRIKGGNCGNRGINIDKIESLVWDKFFRDKLLLNRVKRELEKGKKDKNNLVKEIGLVENKIRELEKENERAIQLVIKETLSEDDVSKILKKNKNKLKDLEIRKSSLINKLKGIENQEKLVKKHDDDFLHYSKNISFSQKKEIVKDYIADIIIKYDDFIDSYNIKIIFKANLGSETYQTFERFTVVHNDNEFILPKTVGENKFRLPEVIEIDGSNIQMLGGDDSVPYKDIGNGILEPVYNTRVPYGNVNEWSNDEIEYFYKHNPDWYCKESGVSLWSKNTETDDYKDIERKYQNDLKKNHNTPTLDTDTSEMV